MNIYANYLSAIELTKNPIHHQRSKHIDVKYLYIRSEIQNNVLFSLYPFKKNYGRYSK